MSHEVIAFRADDGTLHTTKASADAHDEFKRRVVNSAKLIAFLQKQSRSGLAHSTASGIVGIIMQHWDAVVAIVNPMPEQPSFQYDADDL